MSNRMNKGQIWPVPLAKKTIKNRVRAESERNRLWFIVTIPLLFIIASSIMLMYDFFPPALDEEVAKCDDIGGMLWLLCLGATSIGAVVMLVLLSLSALFICFICAIASRVAVTSVGKKIYVTLIPITILCAVITALKMLGV